MSIQPVIITTWRFGVQACHAGWERLAAGASALDAIEAAANVTELDPEVNSVGYGGRPNAEGVVELDAAIMDGRTHAAGAVGGMTGIRAPISVARRVMEQTPHVFLVGDNARRFAIEQGFPEQDLLTPDSLQKWREWKGHPAPSEVAHFDVGPKSGTQYGEPHGRTNPALLSQSAESTPENHDTIGRLESAGTRGRLPYPRQRSVCG
jgi:N4-(beta-N-acetylglucosaminyl)-L-asparaginase